MFIQGSAAVVGHCGLSGSRQGCRYAMGEHAPLRSMVGHHFSRI